jgi:hypothetical protein
LQARLLEETGFLTMITDFLDYDNRFLSKGRASF